MTLPPASAAPAEPGLAPTGAGTPLAGQDAGGGGRAGVVPDLAPPSARVARPDEHAQTGESRREPPGRVTIGTIEVTVVPPTRPARGGGEPRPTPPAVPPRPASSLTEAGGARLRGGLRRWYGIAQS